MIPLWIEETVRELSSKKAYGKITLHMEGGEVTRVNVEQSIKKPSGPPKLIGHKINS